MSQVQMRALPIDERGEMDIKEVERKIRKDFDDYHIPITGLICVQSPTELGTVVSLDYLKRLRELSVKYNIPIHLDGARIFNAAAYLGVEVSEIAQYADSIMFCYSKGLCCPIGSMLIGSKDFIQRARVARKMFGGSTRQAGYLTAGCIVALDDIVPELAIDRKMAELLADELDKIEGISVVNKKPEINMIFFDVDKKGFKIDEFE